MDSSDISVDPGKGWGNFRLGDTISDVITELDSTDRLYELHSDGYVIDIEQPQVTFYFDDASPKRLRQMVFYDPGHLVDDQSVIGLPFAEGLLPFRVKEYKDGIWSLVSIEEEFSGGQLISNSKRVRRASTEDKLKFGTLWLKHQGVGIVMLYEEVHAIALRKVGDLPTVGCGHLNAKEMALALAEREPPSQRYPISGGSKSSDAGQQAYNSKKRAIHIVQSAVLLLLTIVLLVSPGFVVYRDLTKWKNAKDVVGKVVRTEPEGPFPDLITVEYTLEDSVKHRITIPSQYTTAIDIGQSVELLYLVEAPESAVTKVQAGFIELSLPPFLLVGSIAAGLFLLIVLLKQPFI